MKYVIMKNNPSPTKTPTLTKKYFPKSVQASVRKLAQNYRKKNASNESVEDLLRTLVAFPTLSDDHVANKGALKYVERYLRSLGMHTEYSEPDGYPALWATTQSLHKHPRILLAGHIDVMPDRKESFNLRKEGNKYFGRGVMDMKCAIAAYMKALANLEGPLSHYDIGLLLTSDEELGGRDGINGVERYLENGYGAEFVILPDGGDNWKFEQSSKGYVHFTLEAHGKTAHGSRPWEGDNALTKITDLLYELQDHFKDQTPDTSTINIGVIKGGELANKVPGHASAEISFRPIDMDSLTSITTLVQDAAKKHGVTAHLRAAFDPIEHSFEERYLKAFLETVDYVRGEKPKGMRSFGGSDARYFKQVDIPVAVFYPAGNGHHSDNEWMECKSLQQMEDIFTQFLQRHSV